MTKKDWFEKINNEIRNCKKCKRLREITPFSMSHICYNDLSKAKIFFLGRNPGIENDHSDISPERFDKKYHELWWNCNFGKYVRKYFGDTFIKEKMFFSNICKCSSPENSQLTVEEKQNCNSFLKEQLSIIRPKAIVTFGNEPKETINNFEILKNIDIINLVHPAYFNHNRESKMIEGQINKIKKVVEKYG